MGNYAKEFVSGQHVDHSGTTAVDATAQDVVAANGARRFLLFQNNSDTDMWLQEGAAAVASQPSVKVAAGLAFPFTGNWCPTGKISVICATAGKTFTCWEA